MVSRKSKVVANWIHSSLSSQCSFITIQKREKREREKEEGKGSRRRGMHE